MPVYLLRHGESFHNVAMKNFMKEHPKNIVLEWWEIEDAFDPAVRDAALTETGIAQATAMQPEIQALDPTLLVMSPLTRNLQTGHFACQPLLECTDNASAPEVLITPLLREHTYSTCDIGTHPEQLVEIWPVWAHHLCGLPAQWWAHDSEAASDTDRSLYREPWQKLQQRAAELISLLEEKSKEHRNIVVVGHAVLFYALTGNWMANCQLVEFDLSAARPPCECAGKACRCDMDDFNCQQHT